MRGRGREGEREREGEGEGVRDKLAVSILLTRTHSLKTPLLIWGFPSPFSMVVVEGESMSSLLIVNLVINIGVDRLLVDLPSRMRLD